MQISSPELPPVSRSEEDARRTPTSLSSRQDEARRTPTSLSSRRTIGPGGFGKQTPLPSRAPTPLLDPGSSFPPLPHKQETNGLECFLPFKLFRSRSGEQPLFGRGRRQDDNYEAEDQAVQEICQMEKFISETAQTMVTPHVVSCTPLESRDKDPLFSKMETLGDLMKKHKDAFQEEYAEFGPTSVWAPDPPNSNSLPIPVAARKLGKFFDLRGELSTINHVKRARCRQRSPSPVLLNRQPTPVQQTRSATSLSHYERTQERKRVEAIQKNASVENTSWSPPASARAAFPSCLQALYLPPPRQDVNIAEDARYDTIKHHGNKMKAVNRVLNAK